MSYPIERKHPRFDFQKMPWVFGLQAPHSAPTDRPYRIEAKNIALGGCKFLSNEKVALFQELNVSIYSKENGSVLAQIRGKVVRLEEIDIGHGEKTYGIALQFLEPPTGLKELSLVTPHQVPTPS